MGPNIEEVIRRAVAGAPSEAAAASNEEENSMTRHQAAPRGNNTDAELIDIIAQADMNTQAVYETLLERFNTSPSIRAEFPTAADYEGYMKAEVRKRKRTSGPRSDSRPLAVVDTSEAAAIEQANAKNLTGAEANAFWRARWAASPALRGEFMDAEDYSTFMEAVRAGSVRLFRRR